MPRPATKQLLIDEKAHRAFLKRSKNKCPSAVKTETMRKRLATAELKGPWRGAAACDWTNPHTLAEYRFYVHPDNGAAMYVRLKDGRRGHDPMQGDRVAHALACFRGDVLGGTKCDIKGPLFE